MGNCLFRKKIKNNISGNIHLLDDFDSSINDLNYVQYTQNNNFDFNQIQRTQNDFKIQFSNLQNKITKLEVILEQKLDNKIEIKDLLKLTNLAENYDVSELIDSCLAKNKKKTINILNENTLKKVSSMHWKPFKQN